MGAVVAAWIVAAGSLVSVYRTSGVCWVNCRELLSSRNDASNSAYDGRRSRSLPASSSIASDFAAGVLASRTARAPAEYIRDTPPELGWFVTAVATKW